MKSLWLFVSIIVLTMTGCGTSGLESYTKAMEATESYDSGVCRVDMQMDLVFNEEDLDREALRSLSYFERMDQVTTITFLDDEANDQVVVENYSSFGGLGFDTVYYYSEGQMLVELPIMDKYLDLDLEAFDGEGANAWNQVFETLASSWREILNEEDVVVGKKGYVMTDQGQIKATTYTISIDKHQFNSLRDSLVRELEKGYLTEMMLDNTQPYEDFEADEEIFKEDMIASLEAFDLESFEGKAYVDFDGRLVRQVFEGSLSNPSAEAGSAEQVKIFFEMTYDQLGEITTIEIPTVTDDDILKPEDGEDFTDFFPEGLFE